MPVLIYDGRNWSGQIPGFPPIRFKSESEARYWMRHQQDKARV